MERYFLGNNSGYGFWNDYDAELKGKDRVALLKGGPGTGKSTLMKKIAEYAKKAGHDIELWYCSGDPNSLDGVYIKDTNRAVVDATAPHASGVDIPVVKDRIFDLAQSLKPYKLRGVREDIEKLMNCKKQCFMRAYQHLKSALCHCDNKMQLEKQIVDDGGVRAYAYKIADVLRREKCDMKENRKLFSHAICPSGESTYFDHLRGARIYLVDGCEYAISVFFDELSKLLKGCTLLQNPLDPTRYEGVLRGGVAVVSDVGHFKGDVSETVNLGTFQKGGFEEDLKDEENGRVLQTAFAVSKLNLAKKTHEQIEEKFIKAMDFSINEKLTAQVAEFLLE